MQRETSVGRAAAAQDYDTIIRGGTIVDGTGAPKFRGDVGVRGGLIAAVSKERPLPGRAAEEIDAKGKLVCPGWVDVHTHVDGQITWDPTLAPLANNGVTSAVMGNCGVGFAPCNADRRTFLMELMEGVEDIPLGALDAGIKWDWETFPEFLDALGKKHLAMDVAALVGHGPVRAYVLGDRANWSDRRGGGHEHPVTEADIKRMAEVVEDAVRAGAIGFSTSRTLLHRDKRGVLVPGTCAMENELLAIGDAVAAGGGGVFELASDFTCYDDEEHTPENHERRLRHFGREWVWMKQVAKGCGVPVCFCLGIPSATPVDQSSGFRSMLRMLDEATADGCDMTAQVFVRPQSVLLCWDSQSHPFAECPTFLTRVRSKKKVDKSALRDPEVRRALCEEATVLAAGGDEGHFGITLPKSSLEEQEGPGNLNCTAGERGALARMFLNNGAFIFKWQPDCQPTADACAEAVAKAEGKTMAETLYDWLCSDDCSCVLQYCFMNFAKRTLDDSLEMLQHPRTVPGLGDAGAHLGFLCDAASHTYLLSHYARDAGRLTLEQAVKLHSADCADRFGMSDRGRILEGKRADINVIDLEQLSMRRPEFVRDLPTGAARWVQYTSGYTHTLCAGVVTYRDGKHTGALPGRLVRNPFAAHGQKAPALRSSCLGRASLRLSRAKWEVAYFFIFRVVLKLLGPARFEQLGRMMDSKPLGQRGAERGLLGWLPALLVLVAAVLAWRGHFGAQPGAA